MYRYLWIYFALVLCASLAIYSSAIAEENDYSSGLYLGDVGLDDEDNTFGYYNPIRWQAISSPRLVGRGLNPDGSEIVSTGRPDSTDMK